ncbi:unnamed protein product, partial [Closterium sp. NIES-53]
MWCFIFDSFLLLPLPLHQVRGASPKTQELRGQLQVRWQARRGREQEQKGARVQLQGHCLLQVLRGREQARVQHRGWYQVRGGREQAQDGARVQLSGHRLLQVLRAREQARVHLTGRYLVRGGREQARVQLQRRSLVQGGREQARVHLAGRYMVRGGREQARVQLQRRSLVQGGREQAQDGARVQLPRHRLLQVLRGREQARVHLAGRYLVRGDREQALALRWRAQGDQELPQLQLQGRWYQSLRGQISRRLSHVRSLNQLGPKSFVQSHMLHWFQAPHR